MQVRDLRKLIKGLPSNVEIIIGLDNGTTHPACNENSAILSVDMNDIPELVLLIVPCSCIHDHLPEINLN